MTCGARVQVGFIQPRFFLWPILLYGITVYLTKVLEKAVILLRKDLEGNKIFYLIFLGVLIFDVFQEKIKKKKNLNFDKQA